MKQLVVEKNNPEPILWETPVPKPGPGEVLIQNHYSVVSTGTETATIESANKSVAKKYKIHQILKKDLSSLKKRVLGLYGMLYFPKIFFQFSLAIVHVEKLLKLAKV